MTFKWLLTIQDSDAGINCSKGIEGTEEDVRKIMAGWAKQAAEENRESFDYGDLEEGDFVSNPYVHTISGSVVMADGHIDYVAYCISEISFNPAELEFPETGKDDIADTGKIEIGRQYKANIVDSEFGKYSGEMVTVLRPLTEEEADLDDVGAMYEVRAKDGTIFDVFADELETLAAYATA